MGSTGGTAASSTPHIKACDRRELKRGRYDFHEAQISIPGLATKPKTPGRGPEIRLYQECTADSTVPGSSLLPGDTNGIEGDEGERARADECSRVGEGRGGEGTTEWGGGHPPPRIESQRLAHRTVTFADGMGYKICNDKNSRSLFQPDDSTLSTSECNVKCD
ncbi:hypothetical protein NQZ68_025640 [Dissostichus eleginoides]|nr:hypothetical protein NQZ68_025640 [Dissostichus eleginoides]